MKALLECFLFTNISIYTGVFLCLKKGGMTYYSKRIRRIIKYQYKKSRK